MSQEKTEVLQVQKSPYRVSFEHKALENPFSGELIVDLTDYIEILFRHQNNPSAALEKDINQIHQAIYQELSGFDACYISNQFFSQLFDSLDTVQKTRVMESPMIDLLTNLMVEVLKNSIDSWIEKYFICRGTQGFDPGLSYVVRLHVSVVLTADSIKVSFEDNGQGFSKDFLEFFSAKENQLLYVRRGSGGSNKKQMHQRRDAYQFHSFGGSGLGLRLLICSILTTNYNPQSIWFETDAASFASVLRDPSYSISFANGAAGGALIEMTTPINGPPPLIIEPLDFQWKSSADALVLEGVSVSSGDAALPAVNSVSNGLTVDLSLSFFTVAHDDNVSDKDLVQPSKRFCI